MTSTGDEFAVSYGMALSSLERFSFPLNELMISDNDMTDGLFAPVSNEIFCD